MAQRRRNAEKEQFWRLVLEEHAASGMTAREFCRRESISAASFYAWRRTVRARDAQHRKDAATIENIVPQPLVPVKVVDVGSRRAAAKLPLPVDRHQTNERREVVEIVMPSGCTLRTHVDIEADRLRTLLEIVDDSFPATSVVKPC